MSFEWDDDKNSANISVHGLSFYEAQDAFFDTKRLILSDTKHSTNEERYFCIGKTANGGIATVRFTLEMAESALSVPDTGGKERKYMTNNINYADAPTDVDNALDEATIVKDLLPSPAELVRKTEKEKITIAVDKRSLDLYKHYAKKHNAKYQSMMNGVLSSYAEKFLSGKK